MHTRQNVCALADMDPERFKSLARRNMLPGVIFDQLDSVRDHATQGTWKRFSDFQSVLIAVSNALAQQMGGVDGLQHAAAMKIASNSDGGIIAEAIRRASGSASAADTWISFVAYSGGGGAYRSGDLATIAVRVMAELPIGERPVRIFAVNVSDVIRSMVARAEQAGIAFPSAADD